MHFYHRVTERFAINPEHGIPALLEFSGELGLDVYDLFGAAISAFFQHFFKYFFVAIAQRASGWPADDDQ